MRNLRQANLTGSRVERAQMSGFSLETEVVTWVNSVDNRLYTVAYVINKSKVSEVLMLTELCCRQKRIQGRAGFQRRKPMNTFWFFRVSGLGYNWNIQMERSNL